MEKIDLMKCGNLRFKATVDRKEITGKIERSNQSFILTGDDGFGCVITLYELDNLLRGAKFVLKDGSFYVSDFEIVPRDPETYKDWQVGDRATNPKEKWNGSAYKEIIFRSGELVICKDGDGDISGGYTCGQLHRLGYRLVLTDTEKHIIEERKKAEWKPQDGDICYVELAYNWVFIKKEGEYITDSYVILNLDAGNECFFEPGKINNDDFISVLRPATEEEKQRLFDAMAKKGKRWNAEKKVVEDIPKPYEFKKGEPVLVRTDYGRDWKLAAYVELSSIPNAAFGKYGVTDGRTTLFYRFCLPYNEKTMHLLGTNEDYKEEQR